jgi:uncharacterized membrane-anchored protein
MMLLSTCLLRNVLKCDKMNVIDARIYILNTTSLILSMTNIETYLKIALLVVSIGYTLHKWIHLKQNKDGKDSSMGS